MNSSIHSGGFGNQVLYSTQRSREEIVSTKLGSIHNKLGGAVIGYGTEADMHSVINQGEVSMRGTDYPLQTNGTGIGDSP